MVRARGMAAKGMKRSRDGLPTAAVTGEGKDEPAEAGGGGRFFCCYLLRSLCPRRKSATYIGYTVNPRRRIRQHNGEIRCGAWRTKHGRPWEMVLCIHGFPSNVAALQFEWAWQHPTESLAVRKAAAGFKSLGGIGNKVKLAYTMLNLPSWENLNLTVNFFSTKNTKFFAGCLALPSHMKTVVSPMEDLPCYDEGLSSEEDKEPPENHKPEAPASDENSSDHGLQPVELETRIAGCESGESDIDEFAPMEWSGFFGATEFDESKNSESSEPQPVDEEIRIAGRDVEYSIDDFSYIKHIPMHEILGSSRTLPRCSFSPCGDDVAGRSVDGESDIDEFAPMEWSGFFGARELDESKNSESSEPQPVDEEIRIAGRDVEYSIDDFSYIKCIPMHETLGSSRTLPRCSFSPCGDDVAGRSVDGGLGQVSPVLMSDVVPNEGRESDVVDLVTPVGRFARGCSKMASICPKIIDLTSSPVVIEL